MELSKYHGVFLTYDGQVYTCGQGYGGKLGLGHENSVMVNNNVVLSENIYYLKSILDYNLCRNSAKQLLLLLNLVYQSLDFVCNFEYLTDDS